MTAIEEISQRKKDELLATICRLSDSNSKATRGIELLERRATDQQALRRTLIGEDVQNTQTTLKDLEKLLEELGELLS